MIAPSRRTRDKDGKIEEEKKSSLLKKVGSFVETEERNVVLRKGGTLNIPHGNEELRSCKEYKNEDRKSDCEEEPNSGKGKRDRVTTRSQVRREVILNKQ